jgi:hypothetical protein
VGCIGNPGAFVLTAGTRSSLILKDGSGTEKVSYRLNPECNDRTDNDLDARVDTLDFDCASAVDASERLPGLQSYSAPMVPIDVASDGTVTLDPEAVTWPPFELAGIGIELHGVGDPVTSQLVDGEASIDVPLQVDLEGLDGPFSAMSSCSLTSITPHFVLVSYNENAGLALYESSATPVDSIDECGSPYTEIINQLLGLPGTIDIDIGGTISNGSGQHPHS